MWPTTCKNVPDEFHLLQQLFHKKILLSLNKCMASEFVCVFVFLWQQQRSLINMNVTCITRSHSHHWKEAHQIHSFTHNTVIAFALCANNEQTRAYNRQPAKSDDTRFFRHFLLLFQHYFNVHSKYRVLMTRTKLSKNLSFGCFSIG